LLVFINCYLLIGTGVDRLDKDLTVGQMQGNILFLYFIFETDYQLI